jgi:Skp family chaperone for outer membrane proteins
MINCRENVAPCDIDRQQTTFKRRSVSVVAVHQEAALAHCDVQRVELEHAHQAEIDELVSRHRDEVARLERDLANIARNRDEQLLMAESSKQQVSLRINTLAESNLENDDNS